MKLIDNNIETLKDNLISTIQSGSKLSILILFRLKIKQFINAMSR